MQTRTRLAALALLAACGCGPERIPPPRTAPPTIAGPSDAIPADLDVVLRVDVRRVRETLGDEAFARLRAHALGSHSSKDTGAERLMTDALARADLAVIGLRPGRTPELSDSVIALSGDLSGLDPARYAAEPPFDGGSDLGGGFRVYERKSPERAAPARVYTRA